jgi:transcriptional regulator of acetoin/glycerol metabolism
MHPPEGHGHERRRTTQSPPSSPLAEVTSSTSLLIAGAPQGIVYLLVRSESRDEVLVVEDGAQLSFGRTSRAAVRLNSELVSREHARLTRAGGLLEIEDLRSRNGTFVNDRRIEVPTRLRAGSVVRIGGMQIVVAVGEHDASSVGLVVADAAMVQPFALARRAARAPSSPVLVTGEAGSGRSIFAQQIHRWSERRAAPFVSVDGATQPDLVRELEAARGGTLFVDDVEALVPHQQARLAQALAAGVDARVVVATRFDLQTAAAAGRFDADLLLRVAKTTIHAPALRERPAELSLLAVRLVAAHAAARGIPTPHLSREAADELVRHSWPGNLGELRDAIAHAVSVCTEGRVLAEDLPPQVRSKHPSRLALG